MSYTWCILLSHGQIYDLFVTFYDQITTQFTTFFGARHKTDTQRTVGQSDLLWPIYNQFTTFFRGDLAIIRWYMIGPQIGPQFPAKIQIIVLGKSPKFEGKKAPKYGTLAECGPPRMGVRGNHPRKILEIYMQNSAFSCILSAYEHPKISQLY